MCSSDLKIPKFPAGRTLRIFLKRGHEKLTGRLHPLILWMPFPGKNSPSADMNPHLSLYFKILNSSAYARGVFPVWGETPRFFLCELIRHTHFPYPRFFFSDWIIFSQNKSKCYRDTLLHFHSPRNITDGYSGTSIAFYGQEVIVDADRKSVV